MLTSAKLKDFKACDIIGVVPNDLSHVFITGLTGRGKTHLAHAIASSWGEGCMFVKTQTIGQTEHELLTRAKVLILDDLGSEADWDSYRAKVVNVLAEREEKAFPTIVTSNLTLNDIADMDERIASRLGGFRVIQCIGIDRRRSQQGKIPKEPAPSEWRPPYADEWEIKWWLELTVDERCHMSDLYCPKTNGPMPARVYDCKKGLMSLAGHDHTVRWICHDHCEDVKRRKQMREAEAVEQADRGDIEVPF